ncbi:hypothetical protein CRM22_008332 [Opisthorchis felineus]|uniref:Uncharacterized protein n=1 Tax=Opisthorchis felineus TaxID=147828 RepID=A0A4S2LIP8_OPIFE|nr:hypothetical protein CRM22_008332 [Opisthorchis felineus]
MDPQYIRHAQFNSLPEHVTEYIERTVPQRDHRRAVLEIFQVPTPQDSDLEGIWSDDRPLRACFQALRARCLSGPCVKFCTDPEYHFLKKRCAPIGMVLQQLRNVVHDIEEQLKQVLVQSAQATETPVEIDTHLWDMRFPVEERLGFVVSSVLRWKTTKWLHCKGGSCVHTFLLFPGRRVFLWPDSVQSDDPGELMPLWYILMENLAHNFELVMPPIDSNFSYWCDFVLLQLEQVDAVVVTPTPKLFEEIKDALNGCYPVGQTQSSRFLANFLCPRLCCKTDPFQQVRRTLAPTVIGLAGLGLDDAYYFSGFVFTLNSDMRLLMSTLHELILTKRRT